MMLQAKLWALRPASRSVNTRAKKVPVQMLKNNYGKRLRGEVFDVSEGHMRLKLHPEGIAAYVLKNSPPPLPVLSPLEAQRLRKEAHTQAQAAAAKAAEQMKQKKGPTAQNTQDLKVRSLIDALDFPTQHQAGPGAQGTAHIGNSEAVQDAHAQSSNEPSKDPSKEPAKKKFAWQNDFVVDITDKK